jgi:membrane-associated protease RseP (regulator of RpoE activity)
MLAYFLWGFLNLWLAIAAFQLDLAGNGFFAYGIFLVMLFIATLFHEAGHAIAARRNGAQVLVFAALVFEYDLVRRKFGAMRRRLRNREIGGFVAYTWPLGAGTHRKEAIIAAAGPLANFAAAVLAVALVPAFSAPAHRLSEVELGTAPMASGEPSSGPAATPAKLADPVYAEQAYRWYHTEHDSSIRHFVEATLQVFALLSIGVGVINLVPFDGSDGAKLLGHLFPKRRRAKG